MGCVHGTVTLQSPLSAAPVLPALMLPLKAVGSPNVIEVRWMSRTCLIAVNVKDVASLVGAIFEYQKKTLRDSYVSRG